MTLLRGSHIVFGAGIENPSARGTKVDPNVYIPARSPSGITVAVDKILLKETNAGEIASTSSEIVSRKAEGDLEFNVRTESIGYLLKSLLGNCTSTVISGTYKKHAFTVLRKQPQAPTLTLTLIQNEDQTYQYRNALVKSLEIKTPVNDLVHAKALFIASDEEEVTTKTAVYSDTDYIFRPYDVTIKLAPTVADLGAATPLSVKEFNLHLTNNARPQQHIGSITPTDNITGLFEISGGMILDYNNTTFHDIYRDGTYKAMQITFQRNDINLETSYHPKINIIIARVSFDKYDSDRPLDDIVKDKIGFNGHYDPDYEPIEIDVYNTINNYAYNP